jgi:DNA-directed RNA polymerase III subunit RPC5
MFDTSLPLFVKLILSRLLGRLHLHPIAEIHQLRPYLTYLDILSRKSKHHRAGAGSDSDSDDGPPLDPDEPAPVSPPKKDKKHTGEGEEVQVSARRLDEKGGLQPFQGGLSSVRRDMLSIIRTEEAERWQDLEFCDGGVCFLALGLCSQILTLLTIFASPD